MRGRVFVSRRQAFFIGVEDMTPKICVISNRSTQGKLHKLLSVIYDKSAVSWET